MKRCLIILELIKFELPVIVSDSFTLCQVSLSVI